MPENDPGRDLRARSRKMISYPLDFLMRRRSIVKFRNVRVITSYYPDPARWDAALKMTIVILKELPVLQCERCSEYVLEDRVLERVDVMLGKVDEDAELKVLKFAA